MACRAQSATYQVRSRADKRQRLSILTDVSAYFSPAKLSAVMGPSGSVAHYMACSLFACCMHVAQRCARHAMRAFLQCACSAFAQAWTLHIKVFDSVKLED